MEIKRIYDDLQLIEDRLWRIEKQLNEDYLKDRLYEVRCALISNLLGIRELL